MFIIYKQDKFLRGQHDYVAFFIGYQYVNNFVEK